MKSYSELVTYPDYQSRLFYLSLLDGNRSSPREESMGFFKSHAWLSFRRAIIKRDMSFDLAVFGVYIPDKIIVHHINPVTIDDIRNMTPMLLDPENVITTSMLTHNIIHYGEPEEPIVRRPGDTIFW